MQIRKLLEDLESSIWLRPAVWMIGLGSFAILLIALDRRLFSVEISDLLPWFLIGGAEGARTMLGAIVSGTLTITSLAFSLVMVAIVQTSKAYSPRILRQYLGDTQNQHVLGVLLGTFLFSLFVLRSVRSSGDREFVPVLATNVALFLSLVSAVALVYFINHVSQSIKVGNIIHLIMSHTHAVVDEAFPRAIGEAWSQPEPPSLPATEPAIVRAAETGYVQLFYAKDVYWNAIKKNQILKFTYTVGDYVLAGTPLAYVWMYDDVDEEERERIRSAFIMGRERTFSQDVRFGIRQLADIALRALSPGINDPTTAVHAINSLTSLLSQIIQRGPISPYCCDKHGHVRLIFPEITFEDLLDEAFVQILHYGSDDYVIVARLIDVTGQLGHIIVDDEDCNSLWTFICMLMVEADKHIITPAERRMINRSLQNTAAILDKEIDQHLLAEDKHTTLEAPHEH